MTDKFCSKCRELKPIDAYYSHPRTKDKHQSQCKKCMAGYNANRDKVRRRLADKVAAVESGVDGKLTELRREVAGETMKQKDDLEVLWRKVNALEKLVNDLLLS